jgi:hypothetical protein
MGDCRTIYLTACAEIASDFTSDGFHYLKSRQLMIKQDLDLTFRISFQSDPSNWLPKESVEGVATGANARNCFASIKAVEREATIHGFVSMLVWWNVGSSRIQTWRRSLPHPVRTDDVVAGGTLSNLVGNGRTWMIVNLANRGARAERVRTVANLIRKCALPYFQRFKEPGKIVNELVKAPNEVFGIFFSLEYVACHGSKVVARSIIKRHLSSYPHLRDSYKQALSEFRQNGLPPPHTTYGDGGVQLALVALSLGLEPMKRRGD